jgi:hypothetical protein
MWGGYLLHLKRLFEGPAPESNRTIVWALAFLYAASFASIPDANTLLAITSALLLVALLLFHEPLDLAYTGYLILLGALVETPVCIVVNGTILEILWAGYPYGSLRFGVVLVFSCDG